MRQDTLERAVARATGDDFSFIRGRGFSFVDDSSAVQDDDLDAIIRDWDRIQSEILEHDQSPSNWKASIARAPHSRNSSTRRQRRSRVGQLGRSAKAAN
ncbi:hypothetical protein [Schlesneria paludicola]|uniref:hypothetical protein n=1 Tax=Schlesneria paludicola TaxID=360056 RepID=UPI00029A60F4|nr:hypothetical protein [Schlesneria paludicola]